MTPAAVDLHPNRELVRKVSDRVVVALTEDEMRVLVLLQTSFQQAEDEVRELVLLGPEPGVVCVRQDGIQNHQPFDHSAERGRLAMPVVGLANGLVERLVLNMKEA